MQKRVLVVDDDKDLRQALTECLTDAGYSVSAAGTGLQALQAARTLRPDAIIMDLVLPGMDGFAVCESLRRDPDTKRIPILVLTGISSQIARFAGFESGANDYITKPFSIIELRERLKALVAPAVA